jgi:sortase A
MAAVNPEPRGWLVWFERLLLCLGAATATWCAAVWLETQYIQRFAVPRSSLAIGTVVARLEAPAVNLATAVLEGSDEAILNRAAGHIEETALPGERGNIGIAGHRDTIFRPLRRLRVGDALNLSTSDRVFRYRISKTMIVGPEDVYVLNPTTQPTLTLVTCYPFDFIGHAPKRFIIRADLISDATP